MYPLRSRKCLEYYEFRDSCLKIALPQILLQWCMINLIFSTRQQTSLLIQSNSEEKKVTCEDTLPLLSFLGLVPMTVPVFEGNGTQGSAGPVFMES